MICGFQRKFQPQIQKYFKQTFDPSPLTWLRKRKKFRVIEVTLKRFWTRFHCSKRHANDFFAFFKYVRHSNFFGGILPIISPRSLSPIDIPPLGGAELFAPIFGHKPPAKSNHARKSKEFFIIMFSHIRKPGKYHHIFNISKQIFQICTLTILHIHHEPATMLKISSKRRVSVKFNFSEEAMVLSQTFTQSVVHR